MAENKTYRIRTEVGASNTKLNVQLSQTFDTLDILSLKLTQQNAYKLYESSYGIIVGRVLANGGFGIPNAKVSIFIEVDEDESITNKVLYPYTSVTSADNNSVRYNLLPDEAVSECHQNVGTFPNKRLLLDNGNIIEIFGKYWKYTTVTNNAGDYMLFGIPQGNQTLHVDIDLSDIGVLSQRPRDMVYKGYNIDLFESPNKFKQSTNLNSLSQILSQNKGVYVYSFWGDTSESGDTVAITRCDMEFEYKFEPTCVFMGSIITDTGSNAIAKNCSGTKKVGRMEELVAGEGSIEMIRKTLDGNVEECQIKGNRVIDSNGVWCYQIPMNLDYVKTDEYGNIVPTDDPDKGIPTRARVRFRISLDENPNDASARKRCKYLVPNNPRIDSVDYPLFTETLEPDYEFGTATRDESFVNLLWNKVYTVKNYIPRLQKSTSSTKKNHTGIKSVNFYGDNNPFPYNNLSIKLSFTYRLICVLIKVIVLIITFVNLILSVIIAPVLCSIYSIFNSIAKLVGKIPLAGSALKKPFKTLANLFYSMVPSCIVLSANFCDDGVNNYEYAPGCEGSSTECSSWAKTKSSAEDQLAEYLETGEYTDITRSTDLLYTCIENSLAQDNDAPNFMFINDWINGCLYAPLWFRKKTTKKSYLFGLIRKKAKDQWCSSEKTSSVKIYHPCALKRDINGDDYKKFYSKDKVTPYYNGDNPGCDDDCHEQYGSVALSTGVIVPKTTMTDTTAYYYKPLEYNNELSDVVLLFATDIVLLGSLNDCDLNGLPQFFKNLDISTYQLPDDILLTEYTYTVELDTDGNPQSVTSTTASEMSGCDWGNTGSDQCGEPDGGLFYSIGCSTVELYPKSCVNLSRVCEYGVSLDDTKFVHDNSKDIETEDDAEGSENILIPDGYISYDELYDLNGRSMFATLNGNNLRTKLNANGMYEYDLRYLYPENFDGSLEYVMKKEQTSCKKNPKYNYKLEAFSEDYYRFRMGDSPFYYDSDNKFPRYENSFYFYFGLKAGKTAIEQFNSQFFASCANDTEATSPITCTAQSNDWCSNDCCSWDGYIKLDLTNITTPYSVTISSSTGNSVGYENDSSNSCDNIDDNSYVLSITYEGIEDEQIYFSREEISDISDDGYALVNNSGDDYALCLLNDTYTITVIDANENEASIEVTMSNKNLSFGLDTYDFEADSTTLSNNIGTYCEIAQVTPSYNDTDSDNISDTIERICNDTSIGGVLVIKNLYYLNNNILNSSSGDTNNYFIVVKDNEDSDGFYLEMLLCSDDDGKKTLSINSVIIDGSDCEDYKENSGILYDTTNYFIAIGLPYYDTIYSVAITQLCSCDSDDTTANKYSLTASVSGPTATRLEINGIDYALISNFAPGATYSSRDGVNTSSSDEICGWTSLSNYTDDGPYNWNEWYLSKYTVLSYYENLIEEDGSCTVNGVEYTDATQALYAYRKNIISQVKEAFWLLCSTKSVILNMVTDNTPITYSIAYKEEESSEIEDLDLGNIISDCSSSQTTDSKYIEQIEIPTLTYEESEYYDSEEAAKNNFIHTFALYYCGQSSTSKCWKYPYFVNSMDSSGTTIPYDGSYFGVHLIDKELLIHNMVALAYINGIPYYNPSNEELYGEVLTQEGFLCALIYNGYGEFEEVISDSSDIPQSEETFYTTFEEQTLNGDDINIVTYTVCESYEYVDDGLYIPDEDGLPTRRITVLSDSETLRYPNYDYISKQSDNTIIPGTLKYSFNTYSLVTNDEITLLLNDGNCEVEETIYGSMSIKVNTNYSFNSSTSTISISYTIVDADGNNYEGTVTDTINGVLYTITSVTDGNGDITYTIIDSDNNAYTTVGEVKIDIDGTEYTLTATADNDTLRSLYVNINNTDTDYESEYGDDTSDLSSITVTYNTNIYLFEYSKDTYLINKLGLYNIDSEANDIDWGTYTDCLVTFDSDFSGNGSIIKSTNGVLALYVGTTGSDSSLVENGKYFIVAVTSNGCRTISPVYDFTTPEIEKIYAFVNDENYYLGIIFSENYYLRYFSHYWLTNSDDDSTDDTSIAVVINSSLYADYTATQTILNTVFNSEDKIITNIKDEETKVISHCYTLTETQYNNLLAYYSSSTTKVSSIDNIAIAIRDYVGILHTTILENVAFEVITYDGYDDTNNEE